LEIKTFDNSLQMIRIGNANQLWVSIPKNKFNWTR
jgi:hypothetical protein